MARPLASFETEIVTFQGLAPRETAEVAPVGALQTEPANQVGKSLEQVYVILLVLLLFGGASMQNAKADADNFVSDILPLLEHHCWECHDGREAKGELRLDAERYAKREGRHGLRVIGPTREESELYQRLVSDDESYRMPRGADPLTAADIELIGQWIDKGAPWPQTATPEEPGLSQPTEARLAGLIRRVKMLMVRAPFWMAGGIIASVLGVVLLSLRMGNTRSPVLLSKIRVSWMIIVALLFALGGLREYYRQSPARSRSVSIDLSGAPPWQPNKPNYRLAARPMHPRRLGGRYYRGNDERDPLLFNRGFYLTATIDLSLRNELGQVVEAGSHVGSNLFVEILITKAPGATPRLFSKEVLDQVFLSREWIPDWQPAVLEGELIGLETVTPGEQWRARVPVSHSVGERTTGSIYVYRGDREGKHISKANKQYGIHYDLLIANAVITRDSELWMGSMARHPAIQYTPPDRIPATEWFDFRAMPVISGPNSTDPRLLGIESGDTRN